MKIVCVAAALAALYPVCVPAKASSESQSTISRHDERGVLAGPASNFTGEVRVEPIGQPDQSRSVALGLVTFAPSARSHWHTHPSGQSLFVTDGCGWTQHEGGAVMKICKGDAVHVAAGVRHWHGATATSAMTHLAITETRDGRNVDWAEPVTDAQYRAGSEAR